MLHGVKIYNKPGFTLACDTLADYGLVLLADLSIEGPTLRSEFIEIPGANGSLNLSYVATGDPVFNRRKITFTLFKGVGSAALDLIRAEIARRFAGREVYLVLPDAPGLYWDCVLNFGVVAGYNGGKIAVEANAQPYRTTPEVKTGTVYPKPTPYTLNYSRTAAAPGTMWPDWYLDGSCTVEYTSAIDGTQKSINLTGGNGTLVKVNNSLMPGIEMPPGGIRKPITFTGVTGSTLKVNWVVMEL